MLYMDNSVGNPVMLMATEEELEQKVNYIIEMIETEYDGRASADIVYDLLDYYDVETSDLPQWLWNRLAAYLY